MQAQITQPVYRFAPSPNGFLHLGHAYSALLNQQLADECGGRVLLRIEDIDTLRCPPEKILAVFEDLDWIGFRWDGPVVYQSQRFDAYRAVLADLESRGLVYPCFCSRSELRRAADDGGGDRRDPDGVPLYSGTCRTLTATEREARRQAGKAAALRLDLARVLRQTGPVMGWQEDGEGIVPARPECWGDVVLARRDIGTSYHLAVIIDDAMQGVTDVVRGRDLYAATSIHRVIQTLLGLPAPRYRHHRLLTDTSGEKLAKSRYSTPLRALRADGVSPEQIRRMLGFEGAN